MLLLPQCDHRPAGTWLEASKGLQHYFWHNMLMTHRHGNWCLGTLGNLVGGVGWQRAHWAPHNPDCASVQGRESTPKSRALPNAVRLGAMHFPYVIHMAPV